MKYQIEIQELLTQIVEIEAESSNEAISKVNKKYSETTIVLDYDDFVDVAFIDINKPTERERKDMLIDEIIEYLFETEKIRFKEFEVELRNNIHKKLLLLKELNTSELPV